ncbi:MAG: nucleotidyltransferase family protein [Elusimicrobiota bacterium]|nr:nucleotidyltransferase family protein [Elusimicrobiota bacterium]
MRSSQNLSITGIILAAGSGVRLGGKVKALLKTGSKTFIERIILNFRKCKIKNIIVVLGYKAAIVKKYLKEKKIINGQMSINVFVNRNYKSQQLTSLKLAIKNLSKNCAGIIFTPVDHPLVKLTTYKKLLSAFQKDKNKICLPSYNYRKGHPAIFPKEIFEKILTEKLFAGARDLIEKYPEKVKYVVVHDPGTVNDFDSMVDFQKYGLKNRKL